MPIPFDIPASFAAQLASGEVIRVGALLKDGATGRILAHLQETGALQSALTHLSPSAFSPLGLVNTVLEGANTFQLHKLTSMVQTLQTLGMASLGVGVLGIGVSVAGTVLLSRRMAQLQQEVDQLRHELSRVASAVHQGFADIEGRDIDGLFADIKSAFEHAQSLSVQGSANSWENLVLELRKLSNRCQALSNRLQTATPLPFELVQRLMVAELTCRAASVQALVWRNHMKAALVESQANADALHARLSVLNPAEFMARQLGASGELVQDMPAITQRTAALFSDLRTHGRMAQQQTLLLTTLRERSVNGEHYLRELSERSDEPLLAIVR